MVLIVGALTFFPALSLGPIVEHFAGISRKGVLSMSVQEHRLLSLFDRSDPRRRRSSTAFRKLAPRQVAKNPVMFVVEVGSVLTTLLWFRDSRSHRGATRAALVHGAVSLWLWFTVLFANFAEAVAEGRGKAQADTLRRMRTGDHARRTAASNGTAGGSVRRPRCARATWSSSKRAS